MYEIFEKLLREHRVTAYKVAKETGISTATLSSWKKGTYVPKQEKLQLIADYFHVSMDYLMTGSDPDPAARPIYPDLSLDALELARVYMNLSPELKNAVRRTAGLDDIKEKEELRQA